MIIVPEMIGSQVAVYNGKVFNLILVTADMIGQYLGEFSITYRFVNCFIHFSERLYLICTVCYFYSQTCSSRQTRPRLQRLLQVHPSEVNDCDVNITGGHNILSVL